MSGFLRRYWIAAFVVAAFLAVFALLLSAVTARDAIRDHSAFRKNPFGCAALAELCMSAEPPLRAHRLTRPIDGPSQLDGLLLVIDPEYPFADAEIDALLGWVGQGGTLVAAFEGVWDDPSSFRPASGAAYVGLAGALGVGIVDQHKTVHIALPVRASPLARGAERVAVATRYALRPLPGQEATETWAAAEGAPGEVECRLPHGPGDLTPHLVSDGATIVASFTHGKGKVYVSSDAQMFANATLPREDNVAFVANLLWSNARQGTVYFDEYHHGFGVHIREASDVDPAPLQRAAGVAIVACILFLIGKSIRFGAPTPLFDARRRTPVEYVRAMAGLWRGAKAYHWALEQVARAFSHRVAEAAGLPPTAPAERLVAALVQRRGVPREETERLLRDLDQALSGPSLTESRLGRLVRRMALLEEAVGATTRPQAERTPMGGPD